MIVKFKNFLKNQRPVKNGAGFTLIELIVAIGILTMILSLSIANYRGSNQSTLVQLEAYRIVADLRKLQNMALSAIEFESSVPSGGWGISYTATANSYTLFADINNNTVYDGVGELHQTIDMDSNIVFSNSGVITFEPPDPITNFSSAGSEQTIIITDNTTTQSVTVNLLGLIDVVN